jgi:transposase InsO family protein
MTVVTRNVEDFQSTGVEILNPRNGREAQQRLRAYFETYNSRRLHQALEYRPPDEVYFGTGSAPVTLAA